MIPEGVWSQLTTPGPYLPLAGKPETDDIDGLFDDASGPLILTQSNNDLHARWWQAYWLNGTVFIRGEEDGTWGASLNLFDTLQPEKMALTFDQLGRPTVFFLLGGNVNLFWYDPVTEQQEVVALDTGKDPVGAFDIVNNPSDSSSDTLLFYIDSSGEIIMLQQRDRFLIKYQTGIVESDATTPRPKLNILSCGMRIDNRYQVIYRYQDPEYTPPPAIPPVVIPPVIDPPNPGEPPTSGDEYWLYSLSGQQTFINTGYRVIADSTTDSFKISMYIESIDTQKDEIGLFSQHHLFDNGIYKDNLSALIYGLNRDLLRVVVGGVRTELKLPLPIQPGNWSFEFNNIPDGRNILTVVCVKPGNAGIVTAEYDYVVGQNISGAANFRFGGIVGQYYRPYQCLKGMLRDLIIEAPRNTVPFWRIKMTDKDQHSEPLIYKEDGTPVNVSIKAKISPYDSINWVLNKP